MNHDAHAASTRPPSGSSEGPHFFVPRVQFAESTELPADSAPANTPASETRSKPRATFSAQVQKEVERGLQLQKRGRLDEACKVYRQILKQHPAHPDALHLLGLISYGRQHYGDAETLIRQAVAIAPADGVYLNSLGCVLRDAGQLDEAARVFSRLLTVSSGHILGIVNLAKTYRLQNKLSEAVMLMKKGLALEPDQPDLLEEQAYCLCQLHDYKQASALYARLLDQQPDHINALHLRGCCLYHLKEYEAAIALFDKVVDRLPRFGTCYSNKGACHQALAQFDQARACYEKALALDPAIPDAHNNLANVLQVYGEVDAAQKHYQRAMELNPTYIEPQYSLGEIHLLKGDFTPGWKGYAKRILKRDHDHRHFDHLNWNGQPLTDERLLVYSEQGIGDVVMFASCLPDVLQISPHTVLETDPRTVAMFERSFPGLRAIPRSKPTPLGVKVKLPEIDFACAMGDLPQMFRPDVASHPGVAYLRPDEQLLATWKDRLNALGPGLKVGISWRGGKNKEVGTKRSLPLAQWQPILKTPGAVFVNLQYGDCTDEKAYLQRELGVTLQDFPESNPLTDLETFAAQLTACDLVISIDNATVHFAGALGVPCWALLCRVPEWRWLLEGERSYWYRSVRLFRQSKALEWNDVAQRVSEELKKVANDRTLLRDWDHRLGRDDSDSCAMLTALGEHEEGVQAKSEPRPTGSEMRRQVPGSDQPLTRVSLPFGRGSDRREYGTQNAVTAPRLAVITPVGPGHGEIYEENLASIKRACVEQPGPFEKVMPLRLNDLQGTAGRSFARNFGLQQAKEAGCDWVFFLDADDVLVPGALEAVAPYLADYDAIWGQIYSFQHGSELAEAREGQLGKTDRYEDVLNTDPFLTLQMGHFVRTEIALATRFHEQLDAGEDFHYYLRLWEQYRCIKIDQPLFANRRGMHSTGPRSANGRQWMTTVGGLIMEARERYAARQQGRAVPDWSVGDVKGVEAPSVAPRAMLTALGEHVGGALEMGSLETSQTWLPKAASMAQESQTHVVTQPLTASQSMLAQSCKHGTGTVSQAHVSLDHTRYWEADNFQNIIPQNAQLGEFTEGWDARAFLAALLTPYADLGRATGQGDGTILEVGCGYGRLAGAFSPGQYHGVDVNVHAIQKARTALPQHRFTQVGFVDDYPRASLAYAYCVLLHIDDEAIKSVTSKMCQAAPVVVVAEILGRKWRRDGLPPVYNREQTEYEALMQASGYRLFRSCHLPYLHYPNTNISFLLFRPKTDGNGVKWAG